MSNHRCFYQYLREETWIEAAPPKILGLRESSDETERQQCTVHFEVLPCDECVIGFIRRPSFEEIVLRTDALEKQTDCTLAIEYSSFTSWSPTHCTCNYDSHRILSIINLCGSVQENSHSGRFHEIFKRARSTRLTAHLRIPLFLRQSF